MRAEGEAVDDSADSGADGRDRSEDDVVAVAPEEGSPAVPLESVGAECAEVRPPHSGSDDQGAADDDDAADDWGAAFDDR